MNRSEIIKRIQSRTTSLQDFNWDAMYAPPLLSLITIEDINYFRKLATSIKYSSKIDFKYQEIDRIMKMRGFRKLSAGTNRVCYRYLDNDSIVVKIAIDAVGIKDNPREYKNQFYLKPYVTKIFEVSPCGTVALVERVDNITSREEFISIAGHVFDIISNWLVGKYVLEDIGSKYFMNWGLRNGFGPVLLDFPYMYELDGNKLYCSLPLSNDNPKPCEGVIDYDDGFNNLKCTKCGATYRAIELQKALENNLILERGKAVSKMKIMISDGKKDRVVTSEQATKKIETKREKKYKKMKPVGSTMKIQVTGAGNGIMDKETEGYVRGIVDTAYDTESKFIPKPEVESGIVEAMEKVVEEDKVGMLKLIEYVNDGLLCGCKSCNTRFCDDDYAFIKETGECPGCFAVLDENTVLLVDDESEAEDEDTEEVVEEQLESEEVHEEHEVESLEETVTVDKEDEAVPEFEMSEAPVGASPVVETPVENKPVKRPHQRSARFSEDFYKR